MSILHHDDILELLRAVAAARLIDSRTALLAGIDPTLTAAIPGALAPATQALQDLDFLNTAGGIADGTAPLLTWLANAVVLTEPREEATIFRRALERARSTGTAARTSDTDTVALIRRLYRHLQSTNAANTSQRERRDRLIAKVRGRLYITDHLRHEDFFDRYHSGLIDDELTDFKRIRVTTVGLLCTHNRAMLAILYSAPDLLEGIPDFGRDLEILRVHLEFWLNKYDLIFSTDLKMCVLYAGADDGVAFPRDLDIKIEQWLRAKDSPTPE